MASGIANSVVPGRVCAYCSERQRATENKQETGGWQIKGGPTACSVVGACWVQGSEARRRQSDPRPRPMSSGPRASHPGASPAATRRLFLDHTWTG